MTKDDRETLRQWEREATVGPWKADMPSFMGGELSGYVFGPDCEMVADECPECEGVRLRGVGAKLPMKTNALLIAALRTHATDLLDAHERLEQVREMVPRFEMIQQQHGGLVDLLAILKGEWLG